MSSGFATKDRMVAGNRGIGEDGTGLLDTFVWAIGVQRYLKVEGVGFGAGLVDGLLQGAPRVGPPPQRLVLGRSPGLVPADAAQGWARAKNLAAFNTGAFLIPPWSVDFMSGLGWGIWNDLKGMWDLGYSVLDGSLLTQVASGIRTALDMLEKQPSFGFALGQQIGGEMVADLFTAAEGSDFGAFVYEVGKVLGPFLLDIIGGIISGGVGPLVKRGAKAAVEFGGEVAQALTRRVRREFDDLVKAAELVAGPQLAYPDGIPGPRNPLEKPPNAVFAEKDKLIGPKERGTGAGSGSGSGSGPSGPDDPGDPFDPRAAGAGAVGTGAVRTIGTFEVTRRRCEIVVDALASWGPPWQNEDILWRNLETYRNRARRELIMPNGPEGYDSWAWRRVQEIGDSQLMSYEQAARIVDDLQRGAEQQVRAAFELADNLIRMMNRGGELGQVTDAIGRSIRHGRAAGYDNATVSLARGWRVTAAGLEEVRLINVIHQVEYVFLEAFDEQLRPFLPPGYVLGQQRRPVVWRPGMEDPHAEILAARELEGMGCVIGAVATSLCGCSTCIGRIRGSHPWLLHLNPDELQRRPTVSPLPVQR
jgi:hypothetical protein